MLTLRVVNQMTFCEHVKVDQFSLDNPDGSSGGGFTLVHGKDFTLVAGFHTDKRGSLVWVFRELLSRYPDVQVIAAYRANTMRLVRWQRSGNRWIAIKEA